MSLTMPYNQELEEMLIGAVLLQKHFSAEDRKISTVDFYFDTNQRIWGELLAMDEDGDPLEVIDLHQRLDMGNMKISDLMRFTHGVPAYTRPEDIKQLKELATLRNMIRLFSKLARQAEAKENIESIVSEAENVLAQIKTEQEARTGNAQHLAEVMEQEVYPRLDKLVSGEMVKVPFGFERLDNSTNGGASLGELVVFGALPKSGKSCLALQTARNIATADIPTYVLSREMLNYENGFRFLAQTSEYSMNIFRPKMHELVAHRLKEHGKHFYHLPLHFDQKSRTTRDLGKEIARLKESIGLVSVFVDYVQLIQSERRNASRAEKLEEIIYDLKDLAVKHEVVVYANAQFNREGIKSDKPTMAHFDGSSAIEKAANLCLFWMLEKEYDEQARGRTGKLWIEAGRSVAHDEFDIVFHGKESKFSFV